MEVGVGVGYADDRRHAREVLMRIAADDPLVLEDPAPFVHVANLAESSVELKLYAYTRNDDFGTAQSRVIEAVRNQLIEQGLSIPYPTRDLHVYHHDADGRPIGEVLFKGAVDDGDATVVPKPSG